MTFSITDNEVADLISNPNRRCSACMYMYSSICIVYTYHLNFQGGFCLESRTVDSSGVVQSFSRTCLPAVAACPASGEECTGIGNGNDECNVCVPAQCSKYSAKGTCNNSNVACSMVPLLVVIINRGHSPNVEKNLCCYCTTNVLAFLFLPLSNGASLTWPQFLGNRVTLLKG